MSTIATMDKTLFIYVSVSQWGGRRNLTQDELGDAGKNRPPKSLASFGSIKLVDPDLLSQFRNAHANIDRKLREFCVRFQNGYATDVTQTQKVIQLLATAKAEYQALGKAFTDDLPKHQKEWAKQNDQWKAMIEKTPLDPARIATRYLFDYQVAKFQLANANDHAAPENAGLMSGIGGLAGTLFEEISLDAIDTYKRSYRGKDTVSQKALRPITRMLGKLRALRYLDARTGPVIQRIESVIGSMPATGSIEGANLSALVGLIHLLSSPEAMCSHGAGIINPDAFNAVSMPRANEEFEFSQDSDDEDLEPTPEELEPTPTPGVAESTRTPSFFF
jgi:hypothetical protein